MPAKAKLAVPAKAKGRAAAQKAKHEPADDDDVGRTAANPLQVIAPVNPTVLAFNAEHMEYINECLRVISTHPEFEDIAALDPLALTEGAREAPFHLLGCTAAMQQAGSAKAGCNFFWQDEHTNRPNLSILCFMLAELGP